MKKSFFFGDGNVNQNFVEIDKGRIPVQYIAFYLSLLPEICYIVPGLPRIRAGL